MSVEFELSLPMSAPLYKPECIEFELSLPMSAVLYEPECVEFESSLPMSATLYEPESVEFESSLPMFAALYYINRLVGFHDVILFRLDCDTMMIIAKWSLSLCDLFSFSIITAGVSTCCCKFTPFCQF